jgi:UDP-GlcNAc3NAcA epimerase
MIKVLTVVGARPQFIKAAIVSRMLKNEKNIREILVHTGQHYDANMSKIFFDELEIPTIDYHLGIQSKTHGMQTGEMIIAIENILMKEKPDWLLIYGDTNSTLSAAIAAAKLHIPIAHVEAGLRSYNKKMPEEINRLVADQLSEVLFAPTAQSVNNLQNEGYAMSRIVEVGDVMYDAALFYGNKAMQESFIMHKLKLHPHEYILATIHRAENTDNHDRLLTIFMALERINDIKPVIMPLHPRTKKCLESHYPDLLKNSKINWIPPLSFFDMIMLEKHASLIITDSGGVQKEAFFYKVPCLTLRDETEWVETIELGWNQLVKPTDANHIYDKTLLSLKTRGSEGDYPYGKGNASELIAKYFA